MFGLFSSNVELQKTSNLSRTPTVVKYFHELTQQPKQKAVKSCLATSPKLPNTPPKVSQHLT